jgi:hypothetical protein
LTWLAGIVTLNKLVLKYRQVAAFVSLAMTIRESMSLQGRTTTKEIFSNQKRQKALVVKIGKYR